MTNNTDNTELDNELANLTDRLLGGQGEQQGDVSPDNRVEAMLVRHLVQTVSHKPVPDPAFRSRLTLRVNQEWDATHRSAMRAGRRPLPRLAALAAVVVVGLGILLILLSESALVGPVQATAVGPVSLLFPVIFIGALVIVGVVVWRRRQ